MPVFPLLGEICPDLSEGEELLDIGEFKEEPPEEGRTGYILTVDDGFGLVLFENFLVDLGIVGEEWLDGFEVFLTVLLVLLPRTRN